MSFFSQLMLFSAKAFIIFLCIFLVLIVFFTLLASLSKNKERNKGRLQIKNLNKKLAETKEAILSEILPKKEFKTYLKSEKKAHKEKPNTKPRVYVLNFNGDIKASSAPNLTEEITALLGVATSDDEVVLRLESPGGMVPNYGLAAAQLIRLRERNIPLTVCVDKVAASGGYMMACIGNKILAAPFAILGSIGVIVQLPNFHRLLKDKHIDFEQQTAGEFKRTISLFGENTEEGREKLQHEIEDIHHQFKNLITAYRPMLDITKVATGEHWLGQQALQLKLVDAIQTSDDYLFTRAQTADIYEISFETKKSFLQRFSSNANLLQQNLMKLFL